MLTETQETGTPEQDAAAPSQEAPQAPDEMAKMKAELDKARGEARYQALARKVESDEFQFRDVFRADRKAAERIAREKWGLTPPEVLGQLEAAERAKDPEIPDERPVVSDYAIAAAVAQREQEESVRKAVSDFADKLALDGERREAFEREYANVTGNRNVTATEAVRYARAAYAMLNDSDVSAVESARAAVGGIVTVGTSAPGEAQPKVGNPIESEIAKMRARRDAASYKNWYKN